MVWDGRDFGSGKTAVASYKGETMGKYMLYQQLADSLRDKIYEGTYTFGDKIPSERTLAATFGISHLTVRKALAILEEEGLLDRRQGNGTFVRVQKHPVDMRHTDGFSGMLRQRGRAVARKVLYSGTRQAGFKYGKIFGIEREEEVFECISLFQDADGARILEYNAVPCKYIPNASDYDYSIYSLRDIYRRNDVEIVEERQRLEIVRIYNPQAELLGMEEGADMLLLSATSCDAQGKVVEWTKIYDNAERMMFYASTV